MSTFVARWSSPSSTWKERCSVTPNLRAGTAQHTVLHEQQRGVFNVETLGSVSSVIRCPSVIDALSFWCAGYRDVTATLGLKGFIEEFVEAFKSKGIEKVFIAYRRDADGDEAAEATAAKLMAEGLHCYRVQFPPGLDANDVVRRHASLTDVTHALGRLLQSAMWIGSGPSVAPIIDEPTAATARAADPHAAPEPEPQQQPAPTLPASLAPAGARSALGRAMVGGWSGQPHCPFHQQRCRVARSSDHGARGHAPKGPSEMGSSYQRRMS